MLFLIIFSASLNSTFLSKTPHGSKHMYHMKKGGSHSLCGSSLVLFTQIKNGHSKTGLSHIQWERDLWNASDQGHIIDLSFCWTVRVFFIRMAIGPKFL